MVNQWTTRNKKKNYYPSASEYQLALVGNSSTGSHSAADDSCPVSSLCAAVPILSRAWDGDEELAMVRVANAGRKDSDSFFILRWKLGYWGWTRLNFSHDSSNAQFFSDVDRETKLKYIESVNSDPEQKFCHLMAFDFTISSQVIKTRTLCKWLINRARKIWLEFNKLTAVGSWMTSGWNDTDKTFDWRLRQ